MINIYLVSFFVLVVFPVVFERLCVSAVVGALGFTQHFEKLHHQGPTRVVLHELQDRELRYAGSFQDALVILLSNRKLTFLEKSLHVRIRFEIAGEDFVIIMWSGAREPG